MTCSKLPSVSAIRMVAVAYAIAAFLVPQVAAADGTPGSATIDFNPPSSAQLGQVIPLKARLLDASGAPISDAQISFTSPSTFFLGATSDVVLAQATTDKAGVATAEFDVRSTGWFPIRAEFRGNDRSAPAKVGGQIMVDDVPSQLYIQHAGVGIPGLNAPIDLGQSETSVGSATRVASGLTNWFPRMSGWPIPMVLIIIWSLYAFVVVQIFRIARAGTPESRLDGGRRYPDFLRMAGGSHTGATSTVGPAKGSRPHGGDK